MSNKAITWAFARTGIKGGAKFVLVTLADMADQEHSCYPGIPELARLTGFGETAVKGHLAALAEASLISRESRFRRDGSRTSSRYYLDVDGAITTNRPKPESDSGGESTKAGIRPTPQSESDPPPVGIRPPILEPSFNPQSEPTDENSLIAQDDIEAAPTVDDYFDQLWKLWPRKDARKTAAAKFKLAARKVPPQDLLDHARRWLAARTHVDPDHMPYAATWLNQERWTDGPPQPPARPAPPASAFQRNLNLVEHFAALEARNEPHRDSPTTRHSLDDRPHPA